VALDLLVNDTSESDKNHSSKYNGDIVGFKNHSFTSAFSIPQQTVEIYAMCQT